MINPLSILFLIPILLIGGTASIYATGYLHGDERKHSARFWFFFVATVVSMVGVALSKNPLAFIFFWEMMGLSSTGLVAFNDRSKAAHHATWIYLLACHAGAALLIIAWAFFCKSDSISTAFTLLMLGLGLKIGFLGLHIWLPDAHPAAPAPASALMSGAMIPLGLYALAMLAIDSGGLFAAYTPFAWTLLILGVAGSVGGILFALPQANLKRLLAYSSIENMGIISISISIALFAYTEDLSQVMDLAIIGGGLHVINHALLKGGLFFGAGSILRNTGTLDLNRLGGLMKRMPHTGRLFTLNALGISGLPPMNSFISEFLIYAAAFSLFISGDAELKLAALLAILALATTGGIATATFTKAASAAFLGEPRSQEAANAVETPKRMYIAQYILFAASCAVTLASPAVFFVISPLGHFSKSMMVAFVATVGIVGLTTLLLLVRRFLCRRGGVRHIVPTWDCGYASPTPRMAYTADSFMRPLADLFNIILHSHTHLVKFCGYFPKEAAIVTETADVVMNRFWRPVFMFFARMFQRIHLLQGGSLHRYILILIVTVAILILSPLFF